MAAVNAPAITRLPAFNGIWKSASIFARHATEATGLPQTSAAAPLLINSPFFSRIIPVVRMSISFNLEKLLPHIIRAEEPLSAMVSGNFIFQSLMRESTISIDGIIKSVASYTSAIVIPGPSSVLLI